MIVIVNYGLGNLGSIHNMLKKIGVESKISGNTDDLMQADKIILPGVGAFDSGMQALHSLKLKPVLDELALVKKIPVLGICLGMQLMTKSSEEGKEQGLAWFDAQTIRFRFGPQDHLHKIPNMGWNDVDVKKKGLLFNGFTDTPRFYFVHSYFVACNNNKDVEAESTYGAPYVSAFSKDNLFGVQFHPEKSHRYGMQLLKNFATA